MRPAAARRYAVAELAREIVEALPEPIQEALSAVDVRVKEEVDDEDRARGASAELAGYYWGESAEDESCEDALCPAVGFAVQPEIVVIAANVEPTAEKVATVLLHELGHHLGFSELEIVEGLGLS